MLSSPSFWFAVVIVLVIWGYRQERRNEKEDVDSDRVDEESSETMEW